MISHENIKITPLDIIREIKIRNDTGLIAIFCPTSVEMFDVLRAIANEIFEIACVQTTRARLVS